MINQDTLRITRVFTKEGIDPIDEVSWELRTAEIIDGSGNSIFKQENVEFPSFWEATAVNITAQKYFKVVNGRKESSLKQLVRRVVSLVTQWAAEQSYFADKAEEETFRDELMYALIHQYYSFNSPVYFNFGVSDNPQASACFILDVEDNIESISDLIKLEAKIFKGGSGAGVNLSKIRSSFETLSKGGKASGPVSFMRALDANCGTIKSGGSTRRAAAMRVLNIDHPDIYETADSKAGFINCKAIEEKKAKAIIEAGLGGKGLYEDAYSSVQYQNANNSVRVTDSFMRAVLEDGIWETKKKDGSVIQKYKARFLFQEICQAAYACGDPGLQFHDTANKFNTTKSTNTIESTNPCGEFSASKYRACNLGSINLIKCVDFENQKRGELPAFLFDKYEHLTALGVLAQSALINKAYYPMERIAEETKKYRDIGLGYTNLGALLMVYGMPYDSPEGRMLSGALASVLTAHAFCISSVLASRIGTFPAYPENKVEMEKVIDLHTDIASRSPQVQSNSGKLAWEMWEKGKGWWLRAQGLGKKFGFSNSQVTLLAPNGTIGFFMGCSTLGIEPEFGLVSYKTLSGEGTIVRINQDVKNALFTLGYSDDAIKSIQDWLSGKHKGCLETCPDLKPEHLPIFDCASSPMGGKRFIKPSGHVEMMAAVQPFLSGAISKTVNMPSSATVEDVWDIYMTAWRSGLKGIAIYRDGCKGAQPISTSEKKEKTQDSSIIHPRQQKMPKERDQKCFEFTIGGAFQGWLQVGPYPKGHQWEGRVGEFFARMGKAGSTLEGVLNCFGIVCSLALQYGVPLDKLVEKLNDVRFEPAGFTDDPEVPNAESIIAYIFKKLGSRYSDQYKNKWRRKKVVDITEIGANQLSPEHLKEQDEIESKIISTGPPCQFCGNMTRRTGSCWTCMSCGSTTGCS